MKKIKLRQYIIDHKIRSTLYIIKTNAHGGIADGTKRMIRALRYKVGNIRFVLLHEQIPTIKETFDLVITDNIGSATIEKVKKIVKFNRLLVIYKHRVFDTHINNKYDTIEIPLTHKNDLNRVLELQRVRRKRNYAQLAGKKVGHYIGVALVALVMLFPSLILAIQLGQYKPDNVFSLTVSNNKSNKVQYNTKYSALTYNTGFTAYNQDMHFYMDCPGQEVWGGQGTAQSKKAVEASLNGIKRILTTQDHDTAEIVDSTADCKTYELKGSRIYTTQFEEKTYTKEGEEIKYYPRVTTGSDKYVTDQDIVSFNDSLNDEGDGLFDFVALQEQDINCPKSYNTNQPQIINDAKVWKDDTEYKWSDIYNSTFALNFSTPFIPIPLNDMFGKTVSGLSTFSKYYNSDAYRIALPDIKTSPFNMFEMKRCLSANYFPIGNEPNPQDQKFFVFINAHLSAYDSGGNIRKEQLQTLNELLEILDDKGYYYIVAADWNQILPDTRGYEGKDALKSEQEPKYDSDVPTMPWDFIEFDYKHGNAKSPDMEKDFIQPQPYSDAKQYKEGDLVTYEFKGELPAWYADWAPLRYIDGTTEPIPGHNGPLTQYMLSTTSHNYQAEIDNPTEPPVLPNGEKSSQWRYSLSTDAVYKDASLNDCVRDKLLHVAYNGDEYQPHTVDHYYKAEANFYTTHAIPTLRNAGEQFRNESRLAVGHCYKASIDGFLVSNNIKVYQTFGFDTNFKYSDHNPVGITFEFVK